MQGYARICGWTLKKPQFQESISMTKYTPSLLHGSCECGTCTLDAKVIPTARLICHCTICQRFMGKSFSDVTVIAAKQLEVKNIEQISFKKYRPPPNLARGLCLNCKKPVVEFIGFGPFKLAFIPSSNFESQHLLPAPYMHIFYEKRLENAPDNLPKYNGYISSQLAIGKMLISRL
ncbi:GFA family protein [Methylophilus luteus]|uniref:GFA family protein n=1 Tax=Methylophilus luteus TaxID=640108 RepID=A0ABW3F6A1_9PROT